MNPVIHAAEPTKINEVGLARVLESMSGDVELTTLIGAVIYAGCFSLQEFPTGYHFYLTCPNNRTAKALTARAFDLYLKLDVVFPITRLIICTTADPFIFSPPDNWQSAGFIPMPDKTFIGKAKVDYHPSWFILAKLDEDGRVVR